MTYLRSQSQFGTLGPERKQNVDVIIHAFSDPVSAAKHEEAIGKVMAKTVAKRKGRDIMAVRTKVKECTSNLKGRNKEATEARQKRQGEIVATIRRHPLTARQLCALYDISLSTLRGDLRELKDQGRATFTKVDDEYLWRAVPK